MKPKGWALTYAAFGIMDLITTVVAVQYLDIAKEGNPLFIPLIDSIWFATIKLVGTVLLAGLVYVTLLWEREQPNWFIRIAVKGVILAQVAIVVSNAIVILTGSVI